MTVLVTVFEFEPLACLLNTVDLVLPRGRLPLFFGGDDTGFGAAGGTADAGGGPA